MKRAIAILFAVGALTLPAWTGSAADLSASQFSVPQQKMLGDQMASAEKACKAMITNAKVDLTPARLMKICECYVGVEAGIIAADKEKPEGFLVKQLGPCGLFARVLDME
jgi:hypothetical protein